MSQAVMARRPNHRLTQSGLSLAGMSGLSTAHLVPGGRDGRLRGLAADLAVLATAAAAIGLFAVSPEMLEAFGFSYVTAGGGFLDKFHPSTWFAILALALRCAATERPLKTAYALLTGDAGVTILLAAVAVTMFYAIVVSKTPFTGLIDTFVLPALCFLLLRNLHPTILRWIALAVIAVLCVNAVMALAEFLGQFHVMRIDVPAGTTFDPSRSDAIFDWRAQLAADWRATALLGHPLANGLIVGCFLVCLAAAGSDWIPTGAKLPLALLQGASMFAFGARTSLVLTLALAAVLLARRGLAALSRGARFEPRALAFAMLGLLGLAALAGIVFATGLADRTIERFAADDGSAKSRVTMFALFQPLSWTDIMLGPDPEVVATAQRLEGLEFGIESSWIGLVLTYGLLVTSFITVGLVAFSRSLVRACGSGALAILAFYFVSVSVTASLSGKTTSLAVVVVLTQLMLPRPAKPHA